MHSSVKNYALFWYWDVLEQDCFNKQGSSGGGQQSPKECKALLLCNKLMELLKAVVIPKIKC